MTDHPSRRDLLKGAALASAGLVLGANAAFAQGSDAAADGPVDLFTGRSTGAASMIGVPFERRETVRIAIVGTGDRKSTRLNSSHRL